MAISTVTARSVTLKNSDGTKDTYLFKVDGANVEGVVASATSAIVAISAEHANVADTTTSAILSTSAINDKNGKDISTTYGTTLDVTAGTNSATFVLKNGNNSLSTKTIGVVNQNNVGLVPPTGAVDGSNPKYLTNTGSWNEINIDHVAEANHAKSADDAGYSLRAKGDENGYVIYNTYGNNLLISAGTNGVELSLKTKGNAELSKVKIPEFTGAAPGIVPKPTIISQDKFLRDDGTWVKVSGGSSSSEIESITAGNGIEVTNGNTVSLRNDINVNNIEAQKVTLTDGVYNRFGNEIYLRNETAHSSSTKIYGGGTASNYGHVKLSDTYTISEGDANASLGASQIALYNVYTYSKNRIDNFNTVDERDNSRKVIDRWTTDCTVSIKPSNVSSPFYFQPITSVYYDRKTSVTCITNYFTVDTQSWWNEVEKISITLSFNNWIPATVKNFYSTTIYDPNELYIVKYQIALNYSWLGDTTTYCYIFNEGIGSLSEGEMIAGCTPILHLAPRLLAPRPLSTYKIYIDSFIVDYTLYNTLNKLN